MDEQAKIATAKRIFKMLEDMAGQNPNQPLGNLWLKAREDEAYNEMITRWFVFEEP